VHPLNLSNVSSFRLILFGLASSIENYRISVKNKVDVLGQKRPKY